MRERVEQAADKEEGDDGGRRPGGTCTWPFQLQRMVGWSALGARRVVPGLCERERKGEVEGWLSGRVEGRLVVAWLGLVVAVYLLRLLGLEELDLSGALWGARAQLIAVERGTREGEW